MLGIAVEDSRAAVTEYARESKLLFPIALDLNSTVKRSYRIFGPPATFFIDGNYSRRGSRPDHAGARPRGDEESRNSK